MLFSLGLIVIIGFSMGAIFEKMKFPSLVGMILTGIILGPAVLNLISGDLLHIAPDIREIALIIILIRAGLSLDLDDLREIGRPALFMCFIPAIFEIVAVTLIAPFVFDITFLEAGIMGCVLAPVSAAVVVPRMLHFMQTGHGSDKKIPQLIMAGTSVDDIFIVVLFSSLLGIWEGGVFQVSSFLAIPISIITGAIIGFLCGVLIVELFKRVKINGVIQILFLLAISFLFVSFEDFFPHIPFSSLLAILIVGGVILHKSPATAKQLSADFTKLWTIGQLLLFVLVGAAVQIEYVQVAGIGTLIVLAAGSIFRFIGVSLSLIGTNLTWQEKLFCGIAYIPKATVQAAMGAIPLAAGVPSGEIILTIAVLAILILAPLGAFLIDRTYQRLLSE